MFKTFNSPALATSPKVVTMPHPQAATPIAHPVSPSTPQAPSNRAGMEIGDWLRLKGKLHHQLLDQLNLAAIEKVERDGLRRQIATMVADALKADDTHLRSDQFKQLVSELLDEVLGLGPLEPLLADPTVSDILVNGYNKVFVERGGLLELSDARFSDERHLLRIIDKIVSRVGRRIDESQPWVDARLDDGSRVNAIIRPCAIDGPSLSIRKFSSTPLTIDRLVASGALSREAAHFLRAAVEARMNVLVSGGTGSGKTTILNALSSFIDRRQRVVTIEDAAELQLQQEHVVRLETRPPNTEGVGMIAQRDLVRNALRMRPDRIVVGEVRGAEAFDMLQAMNTGHDGSMTTLHANTARDALGRLEQMVSMIGSDFPLSAIRSQIAAGINIIVQLSRLSDGSRRVMSISEVTGMEGDVISLQDLFRFERKGRSETGEVLGQFRPTGIRPKCADVILAAGIDLPIGTFAASDLA